MSNSLSERYHSLIDKIVDMTLQGKIRSKEQVYRLLMQGVETGTGEIFERCLEDSIRATEAQLEKKLKASRILRALQTIEQQWQRWQQDNQTSAAINLATERILDTKESPLLTLIEVIDPNQEQNLSREQLKQLAQSLQQKGESLTDEDLGKLSQQLSEGITNALKSFSTLEDVLISWIYEQNRASLGFGGLPEQRGPWGLWSKHLSSTLPQQLFHALAQNQPLNQLIQLQSLEVKTWLELAILTQYLQRGLVTWFDQQPYDAQAGKKLSFSTFLTFAWLWGQLAYTVRGEFAEASLKVMLQVLRTFSQRADFPLYGGIFALLSGEALQDTLNYLDQPLKQVAQTQEKARILTLLGYSRRAMGEIQSALDFHQQALEISRGAGDRICEVANLNHLSRTYVMEENYTEAINYSQRALILARQTGDKLGEANALASLGYSEVFQAKEEGNLETEIYERAINYLQQGLQLAEKLADLQSQALCCNSLGIAHVTLNQAAEAISYLERGIKAAQFYGDLYLQAINFSYLAQAYYGINDWENTVLTGCLGMYLLEQISAPEWRQAAGLLLILQGQLGEENFQQLLSAQRSKIIAIIGVDGYDHLPKLWQQY